MIAPQAVKAHYLRQDDQHKTLKELVTCHNTNMDLVLKYAAMKYLEKLMKMTNLTLKLE